jgi:hypothetical protein
MFFDMSPIEVIDKEDLEVTTVCRPRSSFATLRYGHSFKPKARRELTEIGDGAGNNDLFDSFVPQLRLKISPLKGIVPMPGAS